MKKSEKKFNIFPKIVNTLLPVLLAFLIGAIIIAAIGENPLTVYRIMLGKSLFTAKGLSNTLHYASPLLLTGLAIAITFKANIFNMGVEGQLLLGGFFSCFVGASLQIAVRCLICSGSGAPEGILSCGRDGRYPDIELCHDKDSGVPVLRTFQRGRIRICLYAYHKGNGYVFQTGELKADIVLFHSSWSSDSNGLCDEKDKAWI